MNFNANRQQVRLTWQCAAGSDVGKVRQQNEDAFWADDETGVFVVADGMGGHAAGEVASTMAVRQATLELGGLTQPLTLGRARDKLRGSIIGANLAILEEGSVSPEHSGMGTTATVLILSGDAWFAVGHVGDSRAYLSRDGEVSRITEDHTYVQQLVDQGRLTDEEARLHPRSSLLTRALGTAANLSVDVYDGEIRDGDRFLLSSDGLTTMLPEQRIFKILLEEGAPDQTVDALIEAANEAGGSDNITVIVVDVHGEPAT